MSVIVHTNDVDFYKKQEASGERFRQGQQRHRELMAAESSRSAAESERIKLLAGSV